MEVKMRFGEVDYHRPIKCEKCGGIMVFKGVGEYQCEDCKFVAYDDYGKTPVHRKASGCYSLGGGDGNRGIAEGNQTDAKGKQIADRTGFSILSAV